MNLSKAFFGLMVPCFFVSLAGSAESVPSWQPRRGERIALIGGSLAERMGLFGHFEAFLHSRAPGLEMVVRNFGWPADEVGRRQRPNDYTKLDDPVQVFGPDTLLCFFGFNESFAGPDGVAAFKANYEKLLADLDRRYARINGALQFVLVSPVAFESTGDPLQPDGSRENANLRLYTEAVREVAARRHVPYVDLFTPTERVFAGQPGAQFTINGCHLNEAGDRVVGELLDHALFGSANPARLGTATFEQLRAAVIDKAWVHFQDYRMVNGWYVYGGRNTPFGVANFPAEFAKIRKMVAKRDRYVWDIAQGRAVSTSVDDSDTGELVDVKTSFGTRAYSEPKELRYFTPDEALKAFMVADGYEVNLVASEQDFPELANPVQLNFDGKGRLWVSCMPTYPQWRPGDPKPNDRLLILEDTNGDGRADHCKVFADGLNIPTGFEFANDGVLVVSQPKLLFLQDTNGDDRADVRIELLDGFATDDTHHAIGAFEWSPAGELYMMEGISMSTAVETPWGPFRNHNTSVCYRFDPKTLRLGLNITPCFANPWCYTHDRWGQGFVGDGTGAQQYWATPLSGAAYPARKGSKVFINPGFRPALGCEILDSRHFPENARSNYVIANVIGFNGIGQFRVREEGSGFVAEKLEPLIESSDKNFRPADPQIGPDGALYFGDWHNPLIGHMQYSQRDPNRDHVHGRVYRLTAKGRPLLKTPPVEGQPIVAVLDQLKADEARTTYRARRELRARPAREVLPALDRWIASLDAVDPKLGRHLCEALWVQEGHHAVNPALLARVLQAKDPHARAAATRVLADTLATTTNALALLRPRIHDEHPRVRLEAVRALSFLPTLESAELALEAARHPLDDYLEYTLASTLGALEPVWKAAFAAGTIATDNPAGYDFLASLNKGQTPVGAIRRHLEPLANLSEVKPADRQKSYAALARFRGDAKAGRQVFSRICVSCHKVGTEGAELGPDLTNVGERLKRAEIVESLIDPNAKVDPKFNATNISTKDGDEYSGIVASEAGDTIIFVVGAGQKQSIPKSQVERRTVLSISPMPEGLPQTMGPQEFVDLIEFLASQK